ncbi:hypothetical protein GCM10008929_13190 [Alkalibacterium psychrotolerans]
MLTIKNKHQLKKAEKDKVGEFIVVGDLAQKIYKTRKISRLSKKAILSLTIAFSAGAIALPFTAGISLKAAGLASTAALTTIGGPSVAFTALSIGGFLVLYALYKDYDVDFTVDNDGKIKAKFTRKASDE